MTKLEKLQHRWFLKTGEPMPDAIARLPMERIVRAVELTESGETVFVPSVPVTVNSISEGSMMEWDSASNH